MVSSIDHARLVNLKVVARLKRGQKLNTRMHYFQIVDKSIFNSMSFFRWLNGESREQTISSLTELVTSCINVDVLKKDDIPIIVEELIKTSGGLCNLIFTYSDDSTVESSLTLIIEQIGRFVEKYGSEKDKQEFKKRCSVLENERANAQIADALEVEEVDSELDQTI
jgi:hypothetical protein